MLGSHNSCSYSKQIGITKLIPKCFSRCQSLTLYEQYKLGVRFFDLRVTFYKGDYYLAHGLIRYNLKFKDVITELSKYDDIIIGVMIEDTFFKFKGNINEVSTIINKSNIPVSYYLYKKSNEYIECNNKSSKTVKWSIPIKKKGRLLIPIRDCKYFNNYSKSIIENIEDIIIFDFIETLK